MKVKVIIITLVFLGFAVKAQQKVIPLYSGAAPGSESWTWPEATSYHNAWGDTLVYNVTHPTLTVYNPDPSVQSTGTAVIIYPGGGFYALSIKNEGTREAAWLTKKGITVFILKYRLVHVAGDDPAQAFNQASKEKRFNMAKLADVPLAIADGRAAIAYVRSHAAEYKLLSNQIGVLGFSAGGTIAVSTAWSPSKDERPDFVGAIYPYMPKALLKPATADAPPLFIAAASDDGFNATEFQNVNLYNDWIAAKLPAELHIYDSGGHGFGMKKQDISADSWIDRFADWLNERGLLKPLNNEKTEAQKNAENFANFQKYFENLLHNDWPWLSKYADADANLALPAKGEKRIVFMGNSITENWYNIDPSFFKDNDYVGRGISGQVSSQMLVRFREDVIDLKPIAVVIEAGTNDIAENRGPISLENTFGNIVSMVQLAKANGIIPIIGSVLPATEFAWHPGLKPAEKIIKLNEMLKDYAEMNHVLYVDYWSALVNGQNGLKPELTLDGLVHPNLAGYKIMEPLVKAAIDRALKKK